MRPSKVGSAFNRINVSVEIKLSGVAVFGNYVFHVCVVCVVTDELKVPKRLGYVNGFGENK